MNNQLPLPETASQTIPFTFESHAVRAINKDGNIWFVAADVCAVLCLKNVTMALRSLDDDEATLSIVEGSFNGAIQKRETNIINESGLYALVMKSRKPEARRFRKWVTAEVLPSIRKTGAYAVKKNPEEVMNEALRRKRFLAWIDESDGKLHTEALDDDAIIASPLKLCRYLSDPEFWWTAGDIKNIAVACVQALAERAKKRKTA